eukprot:9025448-Alexandrium_andersonii.AAC.1
MASGTNEPLKRGGWSIFAARHTLQSGFFGKRHSMRCVLRASARKSRRCLRPRCAMSCSSTEPSPREASANADPPEGGS